MGRILRRGRRQVAVVWGLTALGLVAVAVAAVLPGGLEVPSPWLATSMLLAPVPFVGLTLSALGCRHRVGGTIVRVATVVCWVTFVLALLLTPTELVGRVEPRRGPRDRGEVFVLGLVLAASTPLGAWWWWRDLRSQRLTREAVRRMRARAR